MTWGRLVRIVLGSIRRNAARSVLTILGVVIGVGSVVVMVAIGQGAQAEIQAKIAGLGTNLVVVTPGSATPSGVSGGAGSQASLTVEDAAAIAREAFHVSAVSPVVATYTHAVAGKSNWRTGIAGVDASYFQIRAWPVETGRLFDEADVRASRKVCLLGATVATALFGEGDPVGQIVRLRNVPIEVIGVMERKGQSAEGAD